MSSNVRDTREQGWTKVFCYPFVTPEIKAMAKKLTQIAIEKIKPNPAKRRELPDAGKPGLYLVVQPSGKKSWAVRYRRLSDGRPRKLTLDGFPSLALARKRAQDALDRVADGLDPAAEKKATKAARGSDLLKGRCCSVCRASRQA